MLETVFHTTVMEYPPPTPETSQPSEPKVPGNLRGSTVRLHLLVLDSDAAVRSACTEIATSLGYAVQSTPDLAQARSLLRGQAADILLINLPYGSHQFLELVSEVKVLHPATAVIAMTATSSVNAAVEAMRRGAADYLTKPFAVDELSAVLERAGSTITVDTESRQLRERLRLSQGLGSMIGRSGEMEKLYRILSKVAQSTHPVLVLGESGTGKELVARTIHAYGPNAYKPFLPVDCGSLAPAMIEGELFGYAKGAVPGTTRAKVGLLAGIEGETIFLDEIGELPLDLQGRLHRALQDKIVRPIGSDQGVPLTARVLASTTRDLTHLVETGRFRKDLYFRLNVVTLRIPALRERRGDIPLLAAHILERMKGEHRLAYTFADEALHLLMEYDWPGNVRELERAIERACSLSSGPILHLGDFPTQMQDYQFHAQQSLQQFNQALSHDGATTFSDSVETLAVQSIADLEKQAILTTITQLHGDKLLAARLLGIGKTTLYRKLKEYGLGEELA